MRPISHLTEQERAMLAPLGLGQCNARIASALCYQY